MAISATEAYNTANANAAHEQALKVNQKQMATTASNTASWQLAQAQEAWDLKKKQADQSSKLASEFLTAWTGSLGDMKNMYQSAFDTLTGLTGSIQSQTTGTMGKLTEISDMIGKEYENYRTAYGGAEDEFLGAAREEAQIRQGLVRGIQDASKADYEGVEGRAAADVAGQSDTERQAEARRLMSLGVDPTSGRFGALTKKSSMDEARNTAIAMNVARRGEKERVTNLALEGTKILDPQKTGGMAIAIRKGGNEMLTNQAGVLGKVADVETARTKAITDIAATQGQMTNMYSQSIAQPYGEMAGYFMGQAGGAIPMQ